MASTLNRRYVPYEAAESTGQLQLTNAVRVRFPNLKPTTRTISLRLPETMLQQIKGEANRQDVPYQSYIKMLLAEALRAKTA